MTDPDRDREQTPGPASWADNALVRQWLAWHKQLWSYNPVSRMLPLDVEEIARAMLRVGEGVARRPQAFEMQLARFALRYQRLCLSVARRMMGEPIGESIASDAKDRRFQDRAWSENVYFSALKQVHLLVSQCLTALAAEVPDMDPEARRRIGFYPGQFSDALSPANFPATNPVVLRETLATQGENLRRGLEKFLDDLKRGEITIAPKEQFRLGSDLAKTPGEVVHRNELMELIQYLPATRRVHEVPVLIVPPWINKYYVLDIAPGRSFVEYLLRQGFTVFLISWRNPDALMEDTGMDDYLRLGPLEALRAARAITGAVRVNLIGYCIGGTLLAIALAWLAAAGEESAASGTFLASLQDFEEVGETRVFLTAEMLAEVERRMAEKGYLDPNEMSSVFRLMRSNDLIWNFVVNNYLLGRDPQKFDLMYWSVDGTRMPRAMHSWYLRNMYVENNLVKPGHLELLGQRIDLGRIRCPCYAFAASEDHIVPWAAAGKVRHLVGGPTRLIVAQGGHITAIVNPSGDRRGAYWTGPGTALDAQQWLAAAERQAGSWWPDYGAWLRALSGRKGVPPSLGSAEYPPLQAAPGSYVRDG